MLAAALASTGFAAWLLFAGLPSPDTLAARTSPSTTKILDRERQPPLRGAGPAVGPPHARPPGRASHAPG